MIGLIVFRRWCKQGWHILGLGLLFNWLRLCCLACEHRCKRVKNPGERVAQTFEWGSRLFGKIARRSPIFAFVAFLMMTRFVIGVAQTFFLPEGSRLSRKFARGLHFLLLLLSFFENLLVGVLFYSPSLPYASPYLSMVVHTLLCRLKLLQTVSLMVFRRWCKQGWLVWQLG